MITEMERNWLKEIRRSQFGKNDYPGTKRVNGPDSPSLFGQNIEHFISRKKDFSNCRKKAIPSIVDAFDKYNHSQGLTPYWIPDEWDHVKRGKLGKLTVDNDSLRLSKLSLIYSWLRYQHARGFKGETEVSINLRFGPNFRIDKTAAKKNFQPLIKKMGLVRKERKFRGKFQMVWDLG